MKDHSNIICLCPLEGIINTIAKKWAVLVISIIGHHETIRFNEIMMYLDGISPKTLSDLLKDLHKENIISRESFAETPPRVQYSLTEDGRELCTAIIPLIKWAEKRDNLHTKRCEANCKNSPCISHQSCNTTPGTNST